MKLNVLQGPLDLSQKSPDYTLVNTAMCKITLTQAKTTHAAGAKKTGTVEKGNRCQLGKTIMCSVLSIKGRCLL